MSDGYREAYFRGKNGLHMGLWCITTDFLEKVATVNRASYCDSLGKIHLVKWSSYIYLLLLYNSSILDIKYSPYDIALGSTHTHSDLVTTNTLIYVCVCV